MNREEVLAALGIERENSGVFAGEWLGGTGAAIASIDPTTEEVIATVGEADLADYEAAITVAQDTFKEWRMLPAPERGNYVRLIGDALRKYKEPLGALVSMETGKIRAEGEGEVQEMIDIADFAVGLSRQLYGLTIASERPRHRMYEQWHPLGPIGIITSFNFNTLLGGNVFGSCPGTSLMGSVFLRPSGVTSKIQDKMIVNGNPIAISTMTTVTVQSGRPSLGNTMSTTSRIIKAAAEYMAITLMTPLLLSSCQNWDIILGIQNKVSFPQDKE